MKLNAFLSRAFYVLDMCWRSEEGWRIWDVTRGDHTGKCEDGGCVFNDSSEIHAKFKHVGLAVWFCHKALFFVPAASKCLLKEPTRLSNQKISPVQQTKTEFLINRLWDHFNPYGAQQMLSADLEDRASGLIV